MPRTGDELREISPKKIIEGREYFLPAEKRALLGLLPDETIINRLNAIAYLERTGETAPAIRLHRQIIDTSSTDRVEYLKSFFGFEQALRLFQEEGFIVAPLNAARHLERLVSRVDIIQIYRALKDSDNPIVQEAALDKLHSLLEE